MGLGGLQIGRSRSVLEREAGELRGWVYLVWKRSPRGGVSLAALLSDSFTAKRKAQKRVVRSYNGRAARSYLVARFSCDFYWCPCPGWRDIQRQCKVALPPHPEGEAE